MLSHNSKISNLAKNKQFHGPCEHRHNFHIPFLGPKYLYICARCSGIYIGFITNFILILFFLDFARSIENLIWLNTLINCFFLTVPLVIDWLSQSYGLRHSSNNIRFITGFLTGLAFIIFLVNYHNYWITIPLALFWLYLIVKIGKAFKKDRDKLFGCSACRGILLQAYRYEEM